MYQFIKGAIKHSVVITETYYFFSTTYKILSNILLRQLTSYAEEITGDSQRGFRRNRPTTDHIFCTRQLPEKKWEYKEIVHQLFIDFKKAYDSIRREILYNIPIEFGISMKLARLTKLCLNEVNSRVRVGKNLSDTYLLRMVCKKELLYRRCVSTLL